MANWRSVTPTRRHRRPTRPSGCPSCCLRAGRRGGTDECAGFMGLALSDQLVPGHTLHAQGLCVVSTIARNSLIIWDTERRRGRRKQRGGAVSYARYRTLQTPEIQPSSRGREHRRDRGAECGPHPFSRSAHRRNVRAACGSAAGALAGRLRRRRAPRRSSHAVARRTRAACPTRRGPSRLARVVPVREFAPYVAAGAEAGVPAGASSAWRRHARGAWPRRGARRVWSPPARPGGISRV